MAIFSLSPSLSHTKLLSPLFMQDPKKSTSSGNRKKPWYARAIEMSKLWKTLQKAAEIPLKDVTLWKPSDHEINITSHEARKKTSTRNLKKSNSKRVQAYTRVYLCAPVSSYTDVFQNDVVPPRRSYSYSRSTSLPARPTPGRKIFRGKSLTDDVLMRRFVIEEAYMMQCRRRNEMEIIRRRSGIIGNKKIGPSLLSRMALAHQ